MNLYLLTGYCKFLSWSFFPIRTVRRLFYSSLTLSFVFKLDGQRLVHMDDVNFSLFNDMP